MNRAEAFFAKHPGTEHSDYRTPQYLLNYISARFGEIRWDGACSDLVDPDAGFSNAVAEPLDIFDNPDWGHKWDGLLFINPPWDTPNVKKFIKAAAALAHPGSPPIVFLLPNKLCEAGWCDEVNPYFRSITFLGGRVDYSGPHSVTTGASRWGSFIGVIGHRFNYGADFSSVRLRDLKRDYS